MGGGRVSHLARWRVSLRTQYKRERSSHVEQMRFMGSDMCCGPGMAILTQLDGVAISCPGDLHRQSIMSMTLSTAVYRIDVLPRSVSRSIPLSAGISLIYLRGRGCSTLLDCKCWMRGKFSLAEDASISSIAVFRQRCLGLGSLAMWLFGDIRRGWASVHSEVEQGERLVQLDWTEESPGICTAVGERRST